MHHVGLFQRQKRANDRNESGGSKSNPWIIFIFQVSNIFTKWDIKFLLGKQTNKQIKIVIKKKYEVNTGIKV